MNLPLNMNPAGQTPVSREQTQALLDLRSAASAQIDRKSVV